MVLHELRMKWHEVWNTNNQPCVLDMQNFSHLVQE